MFTNLIKYFNAMKGKGKLNQPFRKEWFSFTVFVSEISEVFFPNIC